jgi:hypothetical protein
MAAQQGQQLTFDPVGLKRVIDAVGLKRVIDAVGLDPVIDAVGPEQVLNALLESEQFLARVSPEKREKLRRLLEKQDNPDSTSEPT